MKIYFLLLFLLIFESNNLQCGEENIEHCLKCGEGAEVNSCQTCEDKYFPFLDNVLCLPCDDPKFGEAGCGGQCNITFKSYSYAFSCIKECKEGYYYQNNKCQSCKNGCKKCSYDSNKYTTICQECLSNQYKLTNEGKCQECYLSGCDKCHFEGENKICDECRSGYYLKNNACTQCQWILQSEGKICQLCSDDKNKYNPDSCNCITHYTKGDSNQYIKCPENCYSCGYNSQDKKAKCFNCDEGYTLNSKGNCIACGDNCKYCYLDANENPVCLSCISDKDQCNKGYYKSDGKSSKINSDDCIFPAIFSNHSLNSICYDLCSDSNYYIMIDYQIYTPRKKTIIDSEDEIYINELRYNDNKNLYNIINYNYGEDNLFKSLNMNALMCIGKLGTGDKNNPKNLRKCSKAIYNQMEDKYECTECMSGYSLDNKTKICLQNINLIMNEHPGLECDVENVGTDSEPIYSCKRCYESYYILATTESKAKICVNGNYYNIYICDDVYVDTNYIKNNYYCLNCSYNGILYDSKYYNKKICQYIYSKIERLDFNITEFSKDKEIVKAKDGICPSKKLFTPDNINCFACNSIMRGCKGSCTFSSGRKNYIECEENGCKTGYIETQKGVCESCGSAMSGCMECHYENEYPSDYKGFKRKRRFVCDQCSEGYLVAADGSCYSCSRLGIYSCEKCIFDEKNNNELVCSQCYSGYFLDEFGKCTQCQNDKVRVNQNKCAYCDNKEYGGIEGCSMCKSDNNTITECELCKEGYILLESNKTCLKISENNQLRNYTNCKILETYGGGSLKCSLCDYYSYALLSDKDDNSCVSFDAIPSYYIEYNKFCKAFYIIDSKYSCKECLDYKYQYTQLTKFTFESNQTSFCDIYYHYDLGGCKEANISEEADGSIKYSCEICYEDSEKLYNSKLKIYYCNYKSDFYESTCYINYCKECKKDNNNNNNRICEKCLDNYEINSITGSCVKKTEKIPSIIFTDIYGLELEQENSLDGQDLIIPSVKLKGITNSQINDGHAFSFYLSIESKKSSSKGQTQEIPMICRYGDDVDESPDEFNIVEYKCSGNIINSENNLLNELTVDDIVITKLNEDNIKNLGNLMPSNLNDLDLANIKEQKSKYTLSNFYNTITFIPDEDAIKNQSSDDYNFDFTLKGKAIGEMNQMSLDVDIPFVEVEKSANCKLNIGGDKSADLNCKVNLKDYTDYEIFSFKLVDFGYQDKTIVLSRINEIYLISSGDGKKGFPTKYIIIIAACGAAVIGIATGVIIYMKKKGAREKINMNNLNMPKKGINPSQIGRRIKKNKTKKTKNTRKDKKNNGKKKKTDASKNENETSKRNMVDFKNKKI